MFSIYFPVVLVILFPLRVVGKIGLPLGFFENTELLLGGVGKI
jgi:hypothetical protein